MIIDAHTHVRLPFEGADHVNIYGVQNAGAEAYFSAMEHNGVDASFVFGSQSFRRDSMILRENEALSRFRDQYPDRVYPWATVCPSWSEKELRRQIRYAIEDLRLHGLKFVPIVQGSSLANPGFDVIAEEASDLNVPFTTHDGSPEYCSAIQTAYYARKYPRLRVLSAHGGLRELWPDLIDAAKELPNLFVCLSGPTQWAIQTFYDELGPEKLLFGSDAGCGPPAIATAYLRRIDRLRAPARHKEMILGLNARRFILGDSA
jgi:predicted TIM-barrel fold metal-dependent hydrolase